MREQRQCKLGQLEVACEEHFTCRCPIYLNIREKTQDIIGTTLSLSHLMNLKNFKKLGKYILELKKHRENLLKDFLVYLPTHEQQLITHSFKRKAMTTNIGIPATLRFSHAEVENQRVKKATTNA